jgi:NADH-quinone oxidoreductase subunit N
MLNILISLTPEIYLALSLSALLVWASIVSIGSSLESTYNYGRLGWQVAKLSIGALVITALRLIDGLLSSLVVESREGVGYDVRSQTLKLGRVFATIRCLVVVTNQDQDSTGPSAAFEYPLLRLLALLGRRFLVSAEDLRIFYLALELQSLALYVLAASARGSAYSTEAGLKYFRLGAFASGLFLLGSSLIYGYLGSTNYHVIGQLLSTPLESSSVEVGFVLIIAAISFKLAAAPFHRWSPDVREGAPATSGRFFATVTKIAALGALIRRCFGPFYGLWISNIGIRPFVLRSGLSRRISALASLGQRRRKRFLAYSAIGHRGFRLRGIATGTFDGLQATLTYLALYVIGSLGRWSVVVTSGTRYFTDLGGLSRRHPALAGVIAVSRFSRAGVPPRAGFLAKLSVLFAARQSSRVQTRYRLAIFSVLVSVVGAYYYLRIIKIRYFAPANHVVQNVNEVDLGSAWVRSISTFITVFVLLNPSLLSILVQRATLSLL